MAEWQTLILDNGLWLAPSLGTLALIVFPWKHWNSLI